MSHLESAALVSVIIPTYHRPLSCLERALVSVVGQTYKNIEIFLIDDNADESISNDIKKLIKRLDDKRITYICNEKNIGSAKSRNKGIELAHGDYITFLDDDDYYLPCKIESQLQGMVARNADYSITNLYLYDQSENLIRKRCHFYISQSDDLLKIHLMNHLTGTDTFMFKKEYLMQIGCFDEIDLGDEFYLMMKAINAHGRFVYLNECHVRAYIHKDGSGLSSGRQKREGENQLYQFKRQYISKYGKIFGKYINMRHHLVLASCDLRERKIIPFTKNSIEAFLIFPTGFVKFIFINRNQY